MTTYSEWDPDERRGDPRPVSGTSESEREAELRRGLAERPADELTVHDRLAQRLNELRMQEDQRLTWDDLYGMFYAEKKVSKATASKWADAICARGVRRLRPTGD